MDAHTRQLVFLLVCIPLRLGLAWFAWYSSSPIFSLLIGLAGIGMIVRAALRDSGKVPMKGFAGGEVYWNSYVHGFLYILFALLHYRHFKYAWIVLVLDVVVGLGTAINHYYL